MRLAGLLLIGGVVACAPPDPIDGASGGVPEVRILFPPADEPIELDPDGSLRTLVVVDLVNIDFAEPGTDNVEGEGHYHLFVQETQYIEAPPALHHELESDAFTAGLRGIINVDLRQNDHSLLEELVGDDCICTAQIEFPVVANGE